MLGISETLVTVVSCVSLAGLLAPVLFLFVRLLSKTRQVMGTSSTNRLTAVGAIIAIAGVIDLIWTQFSIGSRGVFDTAQVRWELATNALVVVALGLIVSIGAQILQAVQSRPRE